jgi:hypothetical protein
MPGNGPESGLSFVSDSGRGWNSLIAVVKSFFDWNLWLVGPTIAFAAVGLALLAGTRRTAVYAGSILGLSVAGSTVIIWSTPSISLDDADVVARLVGTTVITASVLTALVFQDILDTWTEHRRATTGAPRGRRHRIAGPVLAGVLVASVAYPAVVVAQRAPRFPSASDCIVPPGSATTVSVVLGYASSYPDAEAIEAAAARAALAAVIEQDGCGRLRVRLAAPVAAADVVEVLRRVRAAGLTPTIERASG